MKAYAVLLSVAALLQPATPHVMGLGRCKAPPAMSNFQPDQMTGLWYVIEIFSTTSDCMTMTFNRTSTGFKITEAREFYLGNMVNLDHTFTNTGTLTITDSNNPAKMKVDWPSNFLGSADVTIVDTDYNNFAVIFECQSLIFINRASAAILSRNNTLEPSVLQRVKDDLTAAGLDVSDFDVINHRACNKVGEAAFNWGIDEDTFGGIGGQNEESAAEIFENIPDILIPFDAEILEADPTQNEVPST